MFEYTTNDTILSGMNFDADLRTIISSYLNIVGLNKTVFQLNSVPDGLNISDTYNPYPKKRDIFFSDCTSDASIFKPNRRHS